MDTLMIVYLFGWAVWSGVLVEKLEARDIAASLIAGAGWPVGLPIRILRKLLK